MSPPASIGLPARNADTRRWAPLRALLERLDDPLRLTTGLAGWSLAEEEVLADLEYGRE